MTDSVETKTLDAKSDASACSMSNENVIQACAELCKLRAPWTWEKAYDFDDNGNEKWDSETDVIVDLNGRTFNPLISSEDEWMVLEAIRPTLLVSKLELFIRNYLTVTCHPHYSSEDAASVIRAVASTMLHSSRIGDIAKAAAITYRST